MFVKSSKIRNISLGCFALTLLAGCDVGSNPGSNEIIIPTVTGVAEQTLPKPTGPYTVGVRAFAWTDTTRKEIAVPEDGDTREIAVSIWYPATAVATAAPAVYTPELEDILSAKVDERAQGFLDMHKVLRGVTTNSIPAAPIAQTGRQWPVVFFSPGGNVSRHWQTALAEEVASQGFVFVSMAHPHSTIDVAPKAGFSMSRDWDLNNEDPDQALIADNYLADVLTADAVFVLDHVSKLNEYGPFAGKLDVSRVGLMGHSRGGTTVGYACATDPRFAVCAVLDNIGPEREFITGVDAIMLSLHRPSSEDRVASMHEYHGRTGSVAYSIELTTSSHFTCTDLPLFMPDIGVEGQDPVDGIKTCAYIVTDYFDTFLVDRTPAETDWIPKVSADKIVVTKFNKQD